MTVPHVLAIDIGGTKIAAAIMDADGKLHHVASRPTPARAGATEILAATAALGHEVREAAAADGVDVTAAGVGASGAIDPTRGVVTYAGATLAGWAGTRVADELARAFALPVVAENDVNAVALGELHYGAGQGLTDVLVVAVGTGVGGALIIGGDVYHGATFSVGELAHLLVDLKGGRLCNCGQFGHLEAYAAGPAIAARYGDLARSVETFDLRVVAGRAEAGDSLARQAISEGAEILGRALAGLLCVLDPQALIVGGGVADLGAIWWTPFSAALRAGPVPGPAGVQILPARHGGRAVLLGAGWLALGSCKT